MLASGDYPDVVVMSRGDASLDKYITSGAFIALDELIEKSGPDIKEMYGDTLIKTRYKDGKNYYLANWYGLDSDPVFGMLMRKIWLLTWLQIRQMAPPHSQRMSLKHF